MSARARLAAVARASGSLPVGDGRAGADPAGLGTGARASAARDAEAPAVGAVLAVAAALRAGASPPEAWQRSWAVAAPDGIPSFADARRWCADDRHAAAVVAGARLAARTGAPLAAVLDRVGAALADDEAVEVQRRAALAGPRATVRVLTWLPLVGAGLGWSLGADPVGVLLDGGVGTVLLVGAGLLTWAGRRWSGRLLRTAREAGAQS